MPKIRITYYGMEGEGNTVKEAKLDAGSKIEAALSGDHSPTIITKTIGETTYTVFVFRDLARWGYSFVKHGDKGIRGRQYASANENSEEESIMRAFRHIASNEALFDPTGGGWLLTDDKHGLREHKYLSDWQVSFQMWRSYGWDDEACRDFAGMGRMPSLMGV